MKSKEKQGEPTSYNQFTKKQPEFFSKNFIFVSKIVNFLLISYTILTTILYIVIHFNGNSLVKGKSSLLEYDSFLFSNLLVNLSFVVMLVLSFYAVKTKKTELYCLQVFLLVAVLLGLVNPLQTKDLWIFENIRLLKYFIYATLTGLICYLIYFFIIKLVHIRNFLAENFTVEQIIHEIRLRTDMMKFSYNHFMIRTKLNKLFPGLLYKKSSYYYLTCNAPADKEREDREFKQNTGVEYQYDLAENSIEEKEEFLSSSKKPESRTFYKSTEDQD